MNFVECTQPPLSPLFCFVGNKVNIKNAEGCFLLVFIVNTTHTYTHSQLEWCPVVSSYEYCEHNVILVVMSLFLLTFFYVN